MQIAKQTVEFRNGHYQISLPFKDRQTPVPSNKAQAWQRAIWLKKRLERDPKLYQDYKAFMEDILSKGYASKVSPDQKSPTKGTAWYIPHHCVYHPRKPGKIRVVFDCSAKFMGKSLNDMLYKGPDLTSLLVGVLLRFREDRVAVMADIESMFHQVRVPDPDSSFLRFLWWEDGNMASELQEYQMVVHSFVTISSPACANLALRKTADHRHSFPPDVINTVKRNFYVDDCLKSLPGVQKAIEHVGSLCTLLSRGGFKLTKWVSNSRDVLQAIPEKERAKDIKDMDIRKEELPVQRALGIQWCVESDSFRFRVNISSRPPMRRGILSLASATFNPLGFLAPFVLTAKEILQDLCRIKLGWDDEIPTKYAAHWENWLADVPKLSEFAVSRCLKPEDFSPVKSSQLHHFSDASEAAYGSVTYLRLVSHEDRVHCSFLFGKSRVAPLKAISVPRLELSAATVSVRQDKMLKEELEMPPNCESVFWSDRMSVLRYVKNESTRFHTFVTNRVAVLQEGSSPDQWRYVA